MEGILELFANLLAALVGLGIGHLVSRHLQKRKPKPKRKDKA